MRNLVRRYVTQEQRKAENEGVTEDDVNEIKNDISAFRYGIKQKQKTFYLFLVTKTTVLLTCSILSCRYINAFFGIVVKNIC
jgi:hypothetical protein